jgi:hypothetical protein
MLSPGQILCAVVLLIGVPSALRNPTAAALVGAWAVTKAIYLFTGNGLATDFYVFPDIAVIAIIYAKAIVRAGPKDYPTITAQLRSLATDLTVWDRLIVGLFLLGAWPIYVSTLHPYYQWWALFYIAILQFMLAGAESARSCLRSFRARSASHSRSDGLAFAGRTGGYA